MEYSDFTLNFQHKSEDTYYLSVQLPDLQSRQATLNINIDKILHHWQSKKSYSLEDAGYSLYKYLFSEIEQYWESAWDMIKGMTMAGSRRGLRIRLQIDPENHELIPILTLPWEFLFERKNVHNFLGLNLETPLVRCLGDSNDREPYLFSPPLRILCIISSASPNSESYPSFDPKVEKLRLKKALAFSSQIPITIKFLEKATLSELRRELNNPQIEYHILHFMGHGKFNQENGQGMLLFEDDGTPYPIDGSELATHLANISSLRLVFLNACESARVSTDPKHDPFNGVTTALVKKKIPAILAIQGLISQESATIFASTFYKNLAQGICVEHAMQEARKEVHSEKPKWPDWGLPVLYMQVQNGQLFEPDISVSQEQADYYNSPNEPLTVMTKAVRSLFGEIQTEILKVIPSDSEYQREGIEWLNLTLETLLYLSHTSNLSRINYCLEYFGQWSNALSILCECLQEPLVQKYVRVTNPSLVRRYEHLIFDIDSETD